MKLYNLIKPAILSLSLPLAFSASAWEPIAENATEYNFATVKIGGVFPTNLKGNSRLNSGDTVYTGGFEVGRKFMNRYSVGLEYMHRWAGTYSSKNGWVDKARDENTTWSVKSDTFMLNLSADLITDSKIRPYFKVGAGISKNKTSDYVYVSNTGQETRNVYSGSTVNKFAWQVGAGLTMNTTSIFNTQLEYMFVDRGKVESKANYPDSIGNITTSPSRTGRLKDHVVTIGLTFKF